MKHKPYYVLMDGTRVEINNKTMKTKKHKVDEIESVFGWSKVQEVDDTLKKAREYNKIIKKATEKTKSNSNIMPNKKHKVEIPEGYEPIETILSCEEDGNTYITIPLKKLKKELPKTWEEYGEVNRIPDWLSDWVAIPKKHKALGKLEILRDVYNDGWEPDWKDYLQDKYVIGFDKDIPAKFKTMSASDILAFQTEELRDKFLSNFIKLIIEAKPLL